MFMDSLKEELGGKHQDILFAFPLITVQSYGLFLEFATDTPFFYIEKNYKTLILVR